MKENTCPVCKTSRKKLERLHAIANEAARVSELIQSHGGLTGEVQDALHALDFELIEYDRFYDR